MTKAVKRAKRGRGRRVFGELMCGVKAMREHREGRLALRTHRRLVATPKQVAREVLDSVPEDCSLEDIAYHLYVRAQVEEGVRDLDEGRAVPHAQVMREAAEWLRKR